jgi:putative ABC transport system permease protein
MIKSLLKTAYRNLLKNKGFTILNVVGLALGLATCMLIVFYVSDELSYDRYNIHADRIFRLNEDVNFGGTLNSYAISPAPMAAALKNDFPEIEETVRFWNKGGNRVKKDNQNISEWMVYADPSIFSIFTLPMISGNPSAALTEPHSVVITERMVKKYFAKSSVIYDDILGKTLIINDSIPYKVTGVIKDMPRQSHFHFDFFLSMSSLEASLDKNFLSNNFNTYVLLKPGTDYKKLESKFADFFRKRVGPQLETVLHLSVDKFETSGNYFRMSLTPLKEIHLRSSRQEEMAPNGNMQYVSIFTTVALFILLIACINFMNLSTARSSMRAREVGVRKVLGSTRKYLIAQFLTESTMITLLAVMIAFFSAWLFLPLFNHISGKELTVTPRLVGWIAPVLLAITIVVGCVAGVYPALILSGFQPIDVLKGKLAVGFKEGTLRRFLVVFQFAISIFLIIGTLVIYSQLKYIQNKNLGYNRNHVLVLNNLWTRPNGVAKTLEQQVMQIKGVKSAGLSQALPTWNYGSTRTFFKDKVIDQKRSLVSRDWGVDEAYIPTLGIKMAAGRNFSKDMLTDSSGLVINEAAANLLGYTDPLNQTLYLPEDAPGNPMKAYHIIGIMKDFNFRSLRENVTPLTFLQKQKSNALSIRFETTDIPLLLSQIKGKWKEIYPNQPFEYSFLEEDFEASYLAEQRTGSISIAFTVLAVVVACIGLFGLAAYAAEQRSKEIGIRKVLGATAFNIVNLLSREFIVLVLFSIVVASPVAWWFMQTWFLQGFVYRQNIQWWAFACAGLIAILIAFATISFQSIKAALSNPVNSLRSE